MDYLQQMVWEWVDRLVMLLTGQESIQEVILFPQMKQRNK